MTEAQPTSAQQGSANSSSSSSWIPPIPRPLQRVFDSVPLVTYSANDLPYRVPTNGSSSSSLPTLHVFTTDQDAAKGWPSFNPSCLKWQTYLRFAGISHNLTPSTNHASPTGALPFLLPPLPSVPDQRLDPRPLLPIPSSRLLTYASRHSTTTTTDKTKNSPEDPNEDGTENNAHPQKQQAYQSLLDTPIRNAWLYTLYLSPANEPLLRQLYLRPVSRSSMIQQTILSQLRRAARAEIAKTTNTPTPTSPPPKSWSISFFGGGDEQDGGSGSTLLRDLLTWAAVGRQPSIDPELIYAEAKAAFEALEAALPSSLPPPSSSSWFFDARQPTLFDAAVFSYTYLLLAPSDSEAEVQWGDDILRQTVRENCPKIVAHARRIIREYWADVEGVRV